MSTPEQDVYALAAALQDVLDSLSRLYTAIEPHAGAPGARAAIAATTAMLGLAVAVQDISRRLLADESGPCSAEPGPPAADSARGG